MKRPGAESNEFLLVVTLSALEPSDLSDGNFLNTVFIGQLRMNLGVIVIALQIHTCLSVTLDAPAHCER